MNDSVEIARLARANPVEVGPPGPVPTPPGAPGMARRRPRILGPALGLAGAAGLIALIAALIIAGPATEEDAPSSAFDGTMRVSLLERPQTTADRLASVPASIDPGSVRFGARGEGVEWYLARPLGDPGSVCLLQNTDDRVLRLACAPVASLARTGLIGSRRRGGAVVAVVPDGIDEVQIRRTGAPVRDNVAVVPVSGVLPGYAVLTGPATSAITPAASVAVFRRESDTTPVVAVDLHLGETYTTGTPTTTGPSVTAPPTPLTVEGTLAEAVAAMPFTVYVPDPAPTGGELNVFYSRDDPEIFPQVSLSYLPPGTGKIVILLEGAARGKPGAHGAERTVVRGGRERYVSGEGDPSGQVSVRLVLDGTDVQINGAPLSDLLAIADTLTPVAP